MWTLTAFILIKLFTSMANSQGLDFTVKFDSPIYVCSDEESQGFVDASEVLVKRYNESVAVLNGVVKFLKGVEEETMIEFIIEKDVGGAYEILFTHEICDLCKEVADPQSIYGKYLLCFGFPEECPFEPNSYPISDLVADKNDVPPVVSTAPGYYQVTMTLFKSSELECLSEQTAGRTFIACLKLDVVIDSVE